MLTTDYQEGAIPICYVIGGDADGVTVYAVDEANKKRLPIKDFEVVDGVFQPLLNTKTSRVNYAAGPSGSGKSTWVGKAIKEFLKDHPSTPLFLFSRVDEDSAFDGLPFTKILLNQELIENPLNVEELPDNCLCVFDDIDTINNDKLLKSVYNLMGQVMEVGRHKNIEIFITCHLILGNNRKMSRTIMNELSTFTFFPKACSPAHSEYALVTYMGCTKKQVKKILDTESRWVTLFKHYPPIVLDDHQVTFLSKI